VFSNDEIKAKHKLEEIATNSKCVDKRIGRGFARYVIDGDEWMWVRPIDSAKGYRAHKAWIDMDCTIRQLEYVILPICELYCEEFNYF
jgi:hypothetical protein